MRKIDIVGIIGAVSLLAGIAFGFNDAELFDHWYDWVFGPFLWVLGCALMSAFILVRVLSHRPNVSR
jgi:hypothetical protein